MKLFKKDKNAEKTSAKKLINLNAVKKGSYVTGMIAVVLAIVVFLNIGTTLLENRGYLKFDLTAAKANTMSADNEKFLKTIETPVSITVLSTEDEYASSLGSYLEYYMNISSEEDYFSQTVQILKQYEEVNSNIQVQFVDYSGGQAKAIQEEYPNAFIGDIYVEVKDEDGNTASKLITYDKIYPYSDTSGYASMGYDYYYIDGNDLETSLSSAINSLVNGEDEILGVIHAHADEGGLSSFEEYFTSQLEYNGFSALQIEDTVIEKIPEEVSVLAIVTPSTDYLEEEIKVISEWLDNDGKKGHSVIFCPGDAISDMSNLTQFLEEWGISYGSGILYQTDSSQYYSDPRVVYSYVHDSEVANELNGTAGGAVISSWNLPMDVMYETYGTRTTNIIASTSDAATVCPLDAADDWKPDADAVVQSYPTIVVTSDSATVDGEVLSSHVAAFSAFNVVADVGGDFINLDLSMNTARYISGMENSSQLLFVTRVLESETFAGEVSAAGAVAINVIFLGVVPVALVVAGFAVWLRRRKR